MQRLRIALILGIGVLIMFNFFKNDASASKNDQKIAHPQKAGSWYPADTASLDAELNEHLNNADVPTKTKPRIIVVPHPGLIFGGPTAAYSYKAASKFEYRNIFIIATSHLSHFKEIIVGDFDAYSTPFGDIKGNRDISSFLFAKDPNCVFNKDLINQEHSLEMQYPFIKRCFPLAKIIPIVISSASYDTSKELADLLYQALTPDDLVVISTDLSHYPDYKDANELDKNTLKSIASGDPEKFIKYLGKVNSEFPPNTSTAACGAVGVLTGLHLANILNIKNIKILHYENSGDRPVGDKDSVVGYGALAIYTSENESFSDTVVLSSKEKKLLIQAAKDSISSMLNNNKLPETEDIPDDSPLNTPYGVFVTLKLNGQLRGCMGNFEPKKPLIEVVKDTAILSAFKDPRFPQVTPEELKKISISISVLSPRKKVEKYQEIIPGKHGVYVQKDYLGGTYLPQVAPEQNWDREQMLNHLCEDKSGVGRDAWKDGSAELSTYTANVFGEGT